MKYIYLDWNIFNKIEHLETLKDSEFEIYKTIQVAIDSGKFKTPYSNAHINDLIRGFIKDPSYIVGHLDILRKLTDDLCVVQYWGKESITWHSRDVYKFFKESLEEKNSTSDSFSGLLNSTVTNLKTDDSEEPNPELDALVTQMENLINIQLESMKNTPLPGDFSKIFDVDPMFKKIFSRSYQEMNSLALCEDIHELAFNTKKDFTIYKSLKKVINQGRQFMQGQEVLLDTINIDGVPKHLSFDEAIEQYAPKTKTSENPDFDKITNLYSKLDLKGFKSDERFANMIDDSLHVFYAGHCDIFITNDDKCHYKATEIFSELDVETLVMKPQDFYDYIKN